MCQYTAVAAAADPIEQMLKVAGDWGPAQVVLLALFGVLNVSAAWHYFAQTVISISPPFACAKPGPAACLEWTDASNHSAESRPCTSGWTFNLTNSPVTLIAETEWVCDKSWMPYFGQSAFSLGSAVGTLLFGLLADKIGRLPVLVASNAVAAVANVATALAPTTFASYSAVRLLAGSASDSNFNMMYLLVMEYLRPDLRSVGLNMAIGVFYMVGCVSVPWLSRLAGHWRLFLLVTASPAIILLVIPFLVPESARWALAVGKGPQAAIRSMKKIAKLNRRKLLAQEEAQFTLMASKLKADNSANILGLFCSPRLRRNTLILLFKSMVLTLCYDAISRYSVGPDPLAMLSFGSLVILPGCAVVAFLQEKVGRKLLALSALFFCALFIAFAGAIRNMDISHEYSIGLALLGRFAVVVAYNSGAQYTAELVPAQVQAGGVAAIHVAGYLASILSPQVLYLEQVYPSLPELVLGLLAAFGAALCLFLPETSHKTLPVTLEEGEQFGKGDSFLPCADNCSANWYQSEANLLHPSTRSETLLSVNCGTFSAFHTREDDNADAGFCLGDAGGARGRVVQRGPVRAGGEQDCFTCLGDKYMDCCSCIGICPKRNATNSLSDLSKQSNVQDFSDDYTGLFKLYTETPDELMRWVVFTYPVEIDTSSFVPKIEKDIKYQTIDNTEREVDSSSSSSKDRVLILNCTVAFQRQCMSFIKCRDSCYTMGASSVRWFHDGCCECVGESCINYGINESRCPDCPVKKDDDEDEEAGLGLAESREGLIDYEEVTDQKNEHLEDVDDEEDPQKD
ncbi:Hypothetical predicted protein [Cloeon dipterum]|uniref:Major facilitator superfamily (MFS) profile domain-containing protein n=1 Tax=Cloeon dipterum TaxID=197152 RepID=A0A8S1DPQ3_9INSE|nr:Hypothetical predicted protein [Cloeon dipterum]